MTVTPSTLALASQGAAVFLGGLVLACAGWIVGGAVRTPEPAAQAAVVRAPGGQEPEASQPTKQNPASQPASRPSSKPASQPSSRPASRPTSQPSGQSGDGDEVVIGAGLQDGGDLQSSTGQHALDIRAQRSASAMLAAEKRLKKRIKQGQIAKGTQLVPFQLLSNWKYNDELMGMPKAVKELHGKQVLMTGFMFPLDKVRGMKEFLLVESLWACCYGTPPDIHGIVKVIMPEGKSVDQVLEPVQITGRFEVSRTVLEGFVVDIYQLYVKRIERL